MVLCLMWLIHVSFLSLLGKGRCCHPGHYTLCFYDMKARYKASPLTATRKLENIFRRWARLYVGYWWFISLFWSSWVLSTEHHLFFEISTRLLPDGLPLTLDAVSMCTDLRWCACTRSSCWLRELIHVTVVYANIKSNSSFNRPVKCWQLHWRVCYSVRCSYFVVPRVPTSASCIAGAN